MNDPKYRFFSFWFTTIANGGDLRSVKLEDKENYIFTYNSAKKHGSITEDFSLVRKLELIYTKEL